VNCVAFSPDSTQLASASYDQTVRVWDVQSGAEVARLSHPDKHLRVVAFSPDGRLVASALGRTVHLWDLTTGQEARQVGLESEHGGLSFLPGSTHFVSGPEGDDVLRIYDHVTGVCVRRIPCS